MANLNLSEFTEKLFVADADHTFIWDTENSISKRVSRNSWLNSGTLTSDAPVTISQTWNQIGTAFTAFKVNATSTASLITSKLLDLQLGGVSKIFVTRDGTLTGTLNATGFGSNQLYTTELSATSIFAIVSSFSNTNFIAEIGVQNKIVCNAATQFGWGSQGLDGGNGVALRASLDTILVRDGAANTLALRNGANAQTFNVYGTYTSGTVYERLTLSAPSGANAIIGTNKGSGGGTARGLELQTDGVSRLTFNSVGQAAFTNSLTAAAVFYLGAPHYNTFASSASGVIKISNVSESDFNRLQFGGTADSFPAIARDGAGIKFTGAAAGSTSWIKVPPVAVGSLPVAATAGAGARAFVNDALAPTFGSAVTGGGAVLVPVYCTGSAWNVG